MVDAQEIYRRFCATPLRLRTKPSSPPPSSPSTDSNASPVVAQSRPEHEQNAQTELDVERLEERIEVACRVVDGVSPVVENQRGLRTKEAGVAPKKISKKTTTSSRRTSTQTQTANPQPPGIPAAIKSVEDNDSGKKQKRVTRAVVLVNSDTGGVCVDTPTKSSAPPKRSRKSSHQLQQQQQEQQQQTSLSVSLFNGAESPETDGQDVEMHDAEKENVMETSSVCSISRNIMDAFADIDVALPVECVTNKRTKAKKPNKITAAKRQPRATRTPKRAPLAAKLKPLHPQEGVRRSRRLQDKVGLQTTQTDVDDDADQDPDDGDNGSVLMVVEDMELELPEREQLEPAPTMINVESAFCEPLLQTDTASGGLFALWFSALGRDVQTTDAKHNEELVEILSCFFAICMGISRCEAMAKAHDAPSAEADEAPSLMSPQKKKKRVAFRYFDLSALNLVYEEDASAASFAESLIRQYVNAVVPHTATLRERQHHPVQADMIAHIIRVLHNTDRLTEQSSGDGLVATAFRALSGGRHIEIRASLPFFSKEFTKLAPVTGPSHAQSPRFLEEVFESLLSALVRFRLRALFLPFDPDMLLNEGERLKIATYKHEHFGAAIHQALREIHVLQPLVGPLLAIISSTPTPSDDTIKQAILMVDVEDLIHVEQYILACRYLRLSFSRCILLDGAEDDDTSYFCERLEHVCAIARRLQFEGEAHLFPLASVQEFVKVLEHREPSLVVLEKTLQHISMPHYGSTKLPHEDDAEAPCVECNEIVTRAQQDEAITCCSCGGRFHLNCLHLPSSFLQFANQYTCPFCYVGRTR